MSILRIRGGKALSGTVQVSGNKNAALPAIAACLLCEEPVTLHNMPNILDVRHMLEVVEALGAKVKKQPGSDGFGLSVTIDAGNLNQPEISAEHCKKVRTSILFAAPLLHRFGKATIFPPGGDVIGRRRLDTHFYGLRKLGCEISWDTAFRFSNPKAFVGTELFFDEPSVTATEHILMAAAVSEGQTVIRNAASEPHVQDIANLLSQMGAEISGIGTNRLIVTGCKNLRGTEFTIGPDHIETASFLALAAATGGDAVVSGTRRSDFGMARRVFERLGIVLDMQENQIAVGRDQPRLIQGDFDGSLPTIGDGPWPQFPSDMMSSMIVLATQVGGAVIFFEKMFESRLFFVDRLNAMGAHAVLCDPHRVVVTGPKKLRPQRLSSPDIRAGMALVSAALCAEGESEVHNVRMIDRGYEQLERKLSMLGADVERIEG